MIKQQSKKENSTSANKSDNGKSQYTNAIEEKQNRFSNLTDDNAKVNIGIIGVSPDSSPERVKKYNDTSEKDNKML